MTETYTLETLPEILTAQNIADYLVVSRRLVYDLFKKNPSAGGIPNFDIGFTEKASKRVMKDDFIQWIQDQKNKKAG